MAKKIKVGVVGVGFMGSLHVAHYAANKYCDLVGVVDIDAARVTAVAQEYNCCAYTDYRQLLGKVDAVSIAVPPDDHCIASLPFLEANVHLLVEKPLAHTLDDAKRIVKAASQSSSKLLVGHQERFNPAVLAVEDKLGEASFIEADRRGQYDGREGNVDVITDLMIHDIDLVLELVQSPVTAVSAMGSSVVSPHTDIANARLEFENGAVANVTASRVSDKKIRNLRVYAQNRYLTLDLLNQTVSVTSPMASENGGDGTKMVVESVSVKPNQTLKSEISHFVDIICNDAEPLITGDDGLFALEIAQMVRDGVSSG